MNIMKKTRILLLAMASMSLLSACGSTSKPQQSQTTNKVEKMNVKELSKSEFLSKVYNYEASPEQFKFEGNKAVIVDFYATWCGPCKRLAPVIEEIANEYAGKLDVYKVDVDAQSELAQAFRIQSIPTLLFVSKDGKPQIMQGALSKAQLKEIVDSIIQ